MSIKLTVIVTNGNKNTKSNMNKGKKRKVNSTNDFFVAMNTVHCVRCVPLTQRKKQRSACQTTHIEGFQSQ